MLVEENIYFFSCKEVWVNGYVDIYEGEFGYFVKLDCDYDGVVCELKNVFKGVFKVK